MQQFCTQMLESCCMYLGMLVLLCGTEVLMSWSVQCFCIVKALALPKLQIVYGNTGRISSTIVWHSLRAEFIKAHKNGALHFFRPARTLFTEYTFAFYILFEAWRNFKYITYVVRMPFCKCCFYNLTAEGDLKIIKTTKIVKWLTLQWAVCMFSETCIVKQALLLAALLFFKAC